MDKRCGYVAIVGSPNVGKSTLFNYLIGSQLSAISYKPQMTRHQIVGVKTQQDAQFVFVDTPGIHLGAKKLINRVLNKNALNVLHEVHLILWVLDRDHWTNEEQHILRVLEEVQCPVIALVNKIDKLTQREQILKILAKVADRRSFAEIIPISALKRDNLNDLIDTTKNYLPVSDFFYSEAYLTDRDDSFLITEAIREAIFQYLEKELPYSTHVEIEQIVETQKCTRIEASIWVEKNSQKSIIIGHKGEMLKKIGSRARISLQKKLGKALHLQLWIKIKEDWQNNPQVVSSYES